jgi:16S rRNA processing protein RimM
MHPLFLKTPSLSWGFLFELTKWNEMDNFDNLILYAKCLSVHGIRGEFSLSLLNLNSRILKNQTTIKIKKNDTLKDYFLERISYGNKVIIKLELIDNRNEAESFVPFDVYIDKNLLPSLEDGEYYLFDILNSTVINIQNGEKIGLVTGFYENGVQTILQIKLKNLEQLEIIFNKNFIKEVSLEKKEIYIQLPEFVE